MSAGAYDAVLLSSFGGPEGQRDVIPFLRNVTRGRGIPDERLEQVAHHYRHFGGISPINAQNRELKAALEAELAGRGVDLPVYWGNRNWAPYFADVVGDAHDAGHDRLLGLVTSAYTSYSGVGQYREDFEGALEATGLTDVVSIDRIREYFDHPGFIAPLVEGVRDAVARLRSGGEGAGSDGIHVLFVTHSIPNTAADASGPGFGPGGAYVAQHRAVADLVAREAAPGLPYSLVYQSRSGNPATPWLEPDINDAIDELAAAGGTSAVVIVPIGFVSDHMEVLWDLDNEARETAASHGMRAERVPTPGVHPAFVSALVDLIMERVEGTPDTERPHLTALGPWPDHETVGAQRPAERPAERLEEGAQRPDERLEEGAQRPAERLEEGAQRPDERLEEGAQRPSRKADAPQTAGVRQ
ncbi:ferrochelatase [Microbacterium sp. STN6]|uniref:ferrochelatase n=1 Tax=Microbacterium sp. STN6 TaxID=2995588 RepID=UPI0022609647|nr:ferrochelatase [Microbacterium sp. STN6]MCX7522654.1 ferrochelatase [Microbacterium sp. STN6]